MNWNDIPGWFQWRSAQEEAARPVSRGQPLRRGRQLPRSQPLLAGRGRQLSGKRFALIGVDTCRGSGAEGPRGKDYHGAAVAQAGAPSPACFTRTSSTAATRDLISLIVADSVTASTFFADRSIDWVHLDARHDREHVEADIAAWLPKVKPDGWLSGDDYDEIKWPEVVSAVRRTAAGGAALVDQPVAVDTR